MERPGINVIEKESPPAHTSPTDTGQTFAAIVSQRGATGVPILVTSLGEAQSVIGARASWNARYWDAVEWYFKFGGARLYLSRIVGPAAVKASGALVEEREERPEESLNVTAVGEGEWYNTIRVLATADEARRRVRLDISSSEDASVSESSPFLETQEELVNWARNSKYIRLTIGRSALLPKDRQTITLERGGDDRNNIRAEHRARALTVFVRELGPGQVSIPGANTQAEWEALLEHGEVNNRTPILIYPDTEEEVTLRTLAGTVRTRGRIGGAFAGLLTLPGPGQTIKTVTSELAVCGKIAANDAATNGLGQNQPIAGYRRGRLEQALGVTQGESRTWKDPAARTRLNAAGVNLIRQINGEVVIFGWRSLVDEQASPGWANLGHRRLQMAIAAKAEAAMESYLFEEITQRLLKEINGVLTSRVLKPYSDFGSVLDFRVDTDSVNTAETMERREVSAAITVVEAEFAEVVNILITKNLIREGVGA